jgi:tripartite-type tricarboxylate transporter receptor subunit TctC
MIWLPALGKRSHGKVAGDATAVGCGATRADRDRACNYSEAAMIVTRIAVIWLALFGIAAVDHAAVAETYTSKPVKLVVPYAPGGPNDLVARILAQKLADGLGGSFFVENTAGAGGTIATGQAANAAADGTTILVANQDLIVQPIIKAKVPYDPFKSFTPVSLVVSAPEMIVVHPSLQVKDLKELVALLKANPGKYSYASPGYGTTPHLACVWLFNLENGIDVTHVPFQGAAPAVQSVLAGQTPVFHNVLPAVAPHIRAGTMRPLAVASSNRTPYFPDVPTIGEAGYPGHEVGFWMGVFVPAGTSKDLVDVLNKQVARIMTLPDVKERMTTIGFDPTLSTSGELTDHMKTETDKWSKVVRQANIKID